MNCVSVEFSDLLTTGIDIVSRLIKLFGPNGLGIIIIRHVIGLTQARNALFAQGKIYKLDPQIQKYESPDSNYSLGGVEVKK